MDTTIVLDLAPYGQKQGIPNKANPTQQRVLNWVRKFLAMPTADYDHIPVLYLQGGNGSGKTRAFMAAVLEMLTEINEIRVLWGRYDFKDLKLSVMDKFFEIIPAELLAGKNEQYHYYDVYTPQSPSRIYFNGLKDLSGLGSQEFAIIVVTEAHEITEQTYRALKRRCRQSGVPCMILMESEPPNETHWLADLTDPAKENYDPDIEKWELSTYENWNNLPPAYRGSLESMPESAKRKYLLGKTGFSVAGKPYYQGFKEPLHTGEFEYIAGRELLIGWDFGFHFPAVLITQIDLQDRWIWLREIQGRDITIDKFADKVIAELKISYPGSRLIHFGDPACFQVNDKSEFTSWEILKQKGITLQARQSTYRQRKEIIEGKLCTLIGMKPALMIDKRRCKIAIDGFLGGYHYPQRRETQQFEGRFELPFKDGFYEHCFSGETKIRTLSGWQLIKDLIGKNFITYAYDSFSKRLIPAHAKDCRKTRSNVELWKLNFDNGELVATPDHLIMLRDGSYRQLKELTVGTELMPFYEKQRSYQGHMILHLNDGSVVDEHRYIYNWFKGNLRQGYHIHHLDGNPQNNNPDNLEQIEAKVHMQGIYENMRRNNKITNGSTNSWTPECRERMSRYMKMKWRNGTHPLSKRTDKICPICNKIYAMSPRQKYCADCYNRQRNYRNKLRLAEMVNHKVLSVEFYGYGDTYNLEVDTYHNFPANGIMVHNCMNCGEYIAINVFSAKELSSKEAYQQITGIAVPVSTQPAHDKYNVLA